MRFLHLYIILLLLPVSLTGQDTIRTLLHPLPGDTVLRTALPGDTALRTALPADSVLRTALPADTAQRTAPPAAGQDTTRAAGSRQRRIAENGAANQDTTHAAGSRQRRQAGSANAGDADSTASSGSRQWTLSSDFTTEIDQPLDTAFSLFHRYRVADKYSAFNAYTGNYGLPLYQLNFFDREWRPDGFLSAWYRPFMFTPENTMFINTHVPFTELKWSNGGARNVAEQTFRIRHSQNVNREINFGLIYDIVYNIGQYHFQRAIDKNFLFHGSYNGDVYTAYFSAGINNHESSENGGMVSVDDLPLYEPEGIPFMLGDLSRARNTLKNRYLMLVQRYSPGSRPDTLDSERSRSAPVTFSHIGILEWERRRYFDNYPQSGLYDTIMISSSATADSMQQRVLSNTLRVDFAAGRSDRFRIGAGAGIRSELRAYGQVVPGDTLTRPDTVRNKRSSLVLTGKVFNNIGRSFGWSATGDLWLQGYRAGDFIIEGRIYKEFMTDRRGEITWDVTGTMASYTPSVWYSSWGSNNFLWDMNIRREFRLVAGSSLQWPGRRMSLKFNYAVVDNFVRMGAAFIPAQHDGALSILALTAGKEFKVWKIHLDNTILLQQSSNTHVIDLPLVTARSALFFNHLFRFRSTGGDLAFQIGGEAMIHTPYYAMSYMPATGQYYTQENERLGNYPIINAFINLKVKRTRFFIMADHLNSGQTGYNYFLVPGYPLNIRMIKYGLAWTFYD